jgi:phosphatidylglycerol:prolipoprotein diacylglycerol transferase
LIQLVNEPVHSFLITTCKALDFESPVVRIIPRMKYPNIDPVLHLWGPVQIQWYWMMYLIGFAIAIMIVNSYSKRSQNGMTREDLFIYCIAGPISNIIGARVGDNLIYNFSYFVSHPLSMLLYGGMSFHGGLIGVLTSTFIYSRKRGKKFLMLTDLGALSVPPGLFFGRIGNFINGELYGRVTDVPWGMVFPAGGPDPRHPSQLYEAFLEGPVLFLIVYFISYKSKINGMMLSAFLFFYGLFRFIIEFFRQPDFKIGFVLGPFSMGQVLCFMMMGFGIYVYFYARAKNDLTRQEPVVQPLKNTTSSEDRQQ